MFSNSRQRRNAGCRHVDQRQTITFERRVRNTFIYRLALFIEHSSGEQNDEHKP
jgi:hypothetical protein